MCLCAVFMRVENILRKEIVTFHFREKHAVSFTSKYTGTFIFSSLQFGLERVSMTAMAGRERRWSRDQEDGRERGQPHRCAITVSGLLCNLSVGGLFVESFPAGHTMSGRSFG